MLRAEGRLQDFLRGKGRLQDFLRGKGQLQDRLVLRDHYTAIIIQCIYITMYIPHKLAYNRPMSNKDDRKSNIIPQLHISKSCQGFMQK